MLTLPPTVKTRLGINPADTTYDALLTTAIQAVSARFDRFCNRTFTRTVNATHEFAGYEQDISVPCYPIEAVSKFELKSSEAEGWVEQTADPLIRQGCVITLASALGAASQRARVTYTGGYVLPGSVPMAGQTALPADVEHAAIEQVAAWYQNRDKLGLIRHWPSSGTYLVLSQAPLLFSVQQILRKHERWSI